jgi:glutamate-5-semialdehyde dehydrogenase
LARCDSNGDHRYSILKHTNSIFFYFLIRQLTNTKTMSLTNGSPSEAARAAKLSSRTLAILSTQDRNSALQSIHDALSAAKSDVLQANARDLEIATKSAADGELSQSILKRLDLSRPGKFEDMLKGILDVKGLDDPGMFLDRE